MNSCKDCKRNDIPIKPFRTDYICRQCLELLHLKKFKQYFFHSLKKKDHAIIYIINDHTMTFEYTMKLLSLVIEEEKRKRVQVYFFDVIIIEKEELHDIPFHLYERYIINKSKELSYDSSKKIIWLDGSNTTCKSSRILTAITKGDVLTVPPIGWYVYTLPELIISRPIDFTEEEVMEYMQTTQKLERISSESLDKHCEHFIDTLSDEFTHTANTIIATSQRIIEDENDPRCHWCLKKYRPFLNDCQNNLCRTCSSLSLSDTLKSLLNL